MPVLEAVFRSAWPMSFRRPGVFEARVHGPGAASETLAYPMPSTIAGALASLAYEAGLCSSSELAERAEKELYGDTSLCLERLLGENYRIYTGLARHRGDFYAYTGQFLVKLDQLKQALAEAAKEEPSRLAKTLIYRLRELQDIKPRRLRRTGVALNRATKTTAPGLLYSIEMLDLITQDSTPLEILALIEAEESPSGSYLVALGGEQRPAKLTLTTNRTVDPRQLLTEHRGSEQALLMLISPALLRESPWTNGIVDLTLTAAKRLAEGLLEEARLRDTLEPVEPYIVQLTREVVEAVMPGWSLVLERPREPIVLVPAGTVVTVKAKTIKSEDTELIVERLARSGLGCCTRLGWGTIIAVL